jgi:hypothetical protein
MDAPEEVGQEISLILVSSKSTAAMIEEFHLQET